MSLKYGDWISYLSVCSLVVLHFPVSLYSEEGREMSRLLTSGPEFLEGLILKGLKRKGSVKQDKISQAVKA